MQQPAPDGLDWAVIVGFWALVVVTLCLGTYALGQGLEAVRRWWRR